MKKIYYFLVKGGEIIFIWSLIFIVSITLQSVVIKGQVNYGDRCYKSFEDDFIKEYKYDGVSLNYGYLKCNTYYLEYTSDNSEKQNLNFLISIAKLLSDNNVDIDVHVIIKNKDSQIMATIVDYQVSYTVSNI